MDIYIGGTYYYNMYVFMLFLFFVKTFCYRGGQEQNYNEWGGSQKLILSAK